MRRCNCERGGDCSKTTVCAVTELRDDYEIILNAVAESINRMEGIIRNDLCAHRVRNVLAEIDECREILMGRP